MTFCTECGIQIPSGAKFCPNCGHQVPVLSNPNPPEVDKQELANQHIHDVEIPYTLLGEGDVFHDYVIISLLNKDAEGIKYIVKKADSNELLLLKIFHNVFFDRVEKLFILHDRLSKVNKLNEPFIPQIVEVNQKSTPRYMVAKYVQGVSLAHIRQHNPERLSEDFVRKIAGQLIDASVILNTHGLSINELNLVGILLNSQDELTILLSGVSYEADIDEREDVFTIGVILVQLLCKTGFYNTVYSSARLRQNKFTYINGVSMSLNKVLAECLHRNTSHRYKSVKTLKKAFDGLPPISDDSIYTEKESPTMSLELNTVEPISRIKRFDPWFWFVSALILIVIVLLLSTNIYSVLFSEDDVQFKITGFHSEIDTTMVEPIEIADQAVRESSVSATGYGDFRARGLDHSPSDAVYDQRRAVPPVSQIRPVSDIGSRKTSIPEYMVYIESNTFGFGRLKENLHHNVSISGFYISKFEVTQAEWNRFMKPANVSQRGDNLPVENISWFDAVLYANGLSESEGLSPCYRIRGLGASRVVTCDFRANGYRLPTEAEWEMAAKAGKLYNFSGSEILDDVAWYKDNSANKTREVGKKKPNDFGLHDMSGNVAEWCWDWYDANYIRNLSTFVNPTGPETGSHKSIRGGSILNGEGRNINILYRDRGEPSRGYPQVGFRLVRAM